MADGDNESVIDKLRGPKKGMTGGGVAQPTGDSVTKSANSPVLQGPVQRPPAVQTARQQQEASNPYPTLPANPSVGDYISALASQTGRGVANVGRVFADEFTHGSYDRRLAPSGPDAARASTQQASDELGTGGNLGVRTMANIANPIRKISEGAGLVRSGIEGGITGGWDAYEHGGTPLDVAWGAGTGTAANSGLSAVGRGLYQAARKYGPQMVQTVQKYAPTVSDNLGKLINKSGVGIGGGTPSSITQDTKDAADAAFQQLDQNNYHSPHVLNAANQIDTSVLNDPIVRTASPGTHKVLTDFQTDVTKNVNSGAPTTAGNIHTQIKALDDVIARGGQDAASATTAKQQLEGLFSNLPPTNNSASAVVDQFNAAKAAHATYKNAQMLDDMESNLGTYGDMPGPTAKKALQDSPNFYKGPGQQDAMTNIATSGDKAPSLFPYATAAAGGGGGWFGHPLLGGTAGAIVDASRIVDSPAAARSAVYNAYPAMTGMNPVNPQTALTETLKRPGMGILSTGDGKPNPINAVPGSLAPFVFPYMMGQ